MPRTFRVWLTVTLGALIFAMSPVSNYGANPSPSSRSATVLAPGAKFASAPPTNHPIFIYGLDCAHSTSPTPNTCNLNWYRWDENTGVWQGPKFIGWIGLMQQTAAGGGNSFFWNFNGSLAYQIDNGFNTGDFNWSSNTVGWGWNFPKIFGGADGIVYAVRADGHLLWYRHFGSVDSKTWSGPFDVSSNWLQFKDIFSMGQGIIYAVQTDGTLLWYKHNDYATGGPSWTGPKVVGSGWQNFKYLFGVGDGYVVAITQDGRLLRYHHKNYTVGTSVIGGFGQPKADWDGPTELSHGWQIYTNVFAILPNPGQPLG